MNTHVNPSFRYSYIDKEQTIGDNNNTLSQELELLKEQDNSEPEIELNPLLLAKQATEIDPLLVEKMEGIKNRLKQLL